MQELENMQDLFEDFKKEAEESIKKLKNRIRRFKRSRSGIGLWGLYQQLTKEEKRSFIQECMQELNCSKVTVYNYINRRKPFKDEVAKKINNIFNKYGIKE